MKLTHTRVAKIAATLTFKEQRLQHKDIEAIIQDLDQQVVELLATDLPQLLKFEKMKNGYEPSNQTDLSQILRALPTLVQIVYYAREVDMPRAKAELDLLLAEEKKN